MRIWKPVFPVLMLFLAGCTSQGGLVADLAKQRGAEAFDAGLENAEWYICEAASIGSVKRRYAGAMAPAYNDLCDRSATDIVRGDGS